VCLQCSETSSTRPQSDEEYSESAVCSRRSLAPPLPCRRCLQKSRTSARTSRRLCIVFSCAPG
uniref:Uncharacterized protein n=1 Tax=Echeneis naucrates TaxID=173247 RepID=A0A665TH73_ECHNA